MAWFDKDDWLQAYFSQNGCKEDARIDTVGLPGGIDLVEETDMLHIGPRRGVGSACNRAVGQSSVEGIVPNSKNLIGNILCRALITIETTHCTLLHDIGKDLVDLGMVLVDIGSKKPSKIGEMSVSFGQCPTFRCFRFLSPASGDRSSVME